MKIILRGLGTATPPLHVTQEEAYEFIAARFDLKPAERDLYRRILLDGKIKGRYLGMDAKTDSLEIDPDRLLRVSTHNDWQGWIAFGFTFLGVGAAAHFFITNNSGTRTSSVPTAGVPRGLVQIQ